MADNLEDDELGQPDPRQFDAGAQSRIARPNATGSSLPPATLRGLPPPTASTAPADGSPPPAAPATPAIGSVEDLEAKGMASRLAPSPIARPNDQSPIETRTAQDQDRLSELEHSPTGVASLLPKAKGIHNPFLRGLGETGAVGLNVLDKIGTVAGNIYKPLGSVTSAIPGTTAHHNALINEQRGRIGEDLGEQTAQTGLGEVAARALKEKEEAYKAHTEAGLLGQVKPKEEKWTPFVGYTDLDGTPLLNEENSGQPVRADNHKPPTGYKVAPKEAPDKQDPTVKVTRVVNGVPHEVLVNGRTGEDIKDEGQTKVPGESPDAKRSATESAQVEREARTNIRKAEGVFRDTQKSVGQLTAAIDAAKDGNGLLTSFVPTMEVLGINAANGVHRISPAEAQAANLPGSFVERFNAWFDKAATGKTSPELVQEGKALAGILLDSAYSRYKSTYDDENGIVSGYGGTGFDKRVPLLPHQAQGGENKGGAFQVPAGAPAAPKEDGHVLKANGQKIAISKGGQWIAPQ